MGEIRACTECGASLPRDSPLRLCAAMPEPSRARRDRDRQAGGKGRWTWLGPGRPDRRA